MPLPGQDDLLTSLHAGPLETPPWQAFLAQLRPRVDADFCGFFFRQGDAHITDSTEISVGPPQLDLLPAYKAGFHELDPVPYDDLRPGQVHAMAEFITPGNARHERYWRDFLIPGQRQFQRIMRVTTPGGYNAFLVIWRGTHDFTAADSAVLAALGPHLAISLRIYAELERERVRVGISADAARRLAAALRDFASDPLARPRAVRLSDDPWLDMLLRPAGDHVLSGPARPVVTAYLHGDRETGASRVEQFVQLFGLTPSEARLGLALTRGRSIAEAAADQGITEQTARGYSKIVYGKTGARGQADLVRILLASVASLA